MSSSEQIAVMLKVLGSTSILSQPVVAEARLDQSWRKFLEGSCHLQVLDGQEIVVRTNFSATKTRANGESYGYGWTAELDDKIEEFLSKFHRKRYSYTVRLMQRDRISGFGPGRRWRSVKASSSGFGGVPPATKRFRMAMDEKSTGYGHDIDEMIEVEVVEDDDEVNVNWTTGAVAGSKSTTAGRILSEGGNQQDQELKELVLHNIGRFNNSYMLGVKKEVQDLIARDQWKYNVMTSPVSSYLIHYLFRI